MSKILVVENDRMSRELARRVLTAGGHEVVCAGDAEEALRVAPAIRPALVLMDIGLPGMDGIEAARRLRGGPRTASVPVAVLSAQSLGADARRARAAGCVGFLTKPIGARELLEEVSAMIALGASRTKKRGSGRRTR